MKRSIKRVCLIFGLAILCVSIFAPPAASAHPAPSTIIKLYVQKNGEIYATTYIPFGEFNIALGRPIEERTVTETVTTYISNRFRLTSEDQEWQSNLAKTTVKGNYLVADYSFKPPSTQEQERVTLEYSIVLDRVKAHDVLVYVTEANGATHAAGVIVYDSEHNKVPTIEVSLTEYKFSFVKSVRLGIDHLRHGNDHILFLLTLLLVAPFVVLKKKWKPSGNVRKTIIHIVMLSLAFTLGHSLSLLAGSFLNITPIAGYVEVLIAVTIGLSAFHALRPLFGKAELLIVLVFGLIHGLAFSSELFTAQVALGQRLLTTFAFNIGLELCQIVILAVAVPLYLLILHFDKKSMSRIALAGASMACAALWIVSRIIELQ